jgi:hypothetical protein
MPTAQQENVGKSPRRHIVQKNLQYALPYICLHSLAFANARSRQAQRDLFRKVKHNFYWNANLKK